ncbi:MAG TPA: CPBP family intramembrane glutamic endopeptidase [Longimicrobiales bacterium]|nr:CPBP family intramembrane glutamic endopeptidase [Longimicrobiales bacterium]
MLHVARQMRGDFAGLDRHALLALIYTPPALTCIAYLKYPARAAALLDWTPLGDSLRHAAQRTDTNLYAMVWWAVVLVGFYFVVPAILVRFVQKRSLSALGLAFNVERGFVTLTVQCLAIVLPLIYLMSLTPAFAANYPFLKVQDGAAYLGAGLVVWELAYILQFFALEFFFRGFLLHSLKPVVGLYAILIVTIPYTMVHFTKPMPEVFAAIFAGLFLGWLSYRSGTIWLGVLLHVAVALAMDMFALLHKGMLF